MNKPTLRQYKDEDIDQVLDIIQRTWGDDISKRFTTISDLVNNRPDVSKSFPSSYDLGIKEEDVSKGFVVEKEGKIVSYLRCIEGVCYIGDELVKTSFICEFVSDPAMRGQGVKITRHLLSMSETIFIGAPNQSSRTLWNKIRKRNLDVHTLQRHIIVLKPSVFISKSESIQRLLTPLDFAWKVAYPLFLGIRKKIAEQNLIAQKLLLRFSDHTPSNTEIVNLFEEFRKDFYVMPIRDLNFLSWRFKESGLNYQYLWLYDQTLNSDNQLIGYCIYREGYINGRKSLIITEVMAKSNNKDAYGIFIKKLIKLALEKNLTDIQLLDSNCSELRQSLKKHFARIRVEEHTLIASYLNSRGYNDEIYKQRWYISLADSDYDFVLFK